MAEQTRLTLLLDNFLSRTRAAGERAVAIARIVVCGLLVARIVVVGPTLLGGTPRQALHVFMLGFAVVSGLALRHLLRGENPNRHATIVASSVASDAIVLAAALFALVLWPPPGYAGMTQSPATGYVFLVIVFSVLRFSGPLVVGSAIVNGLTLVGLVYVDHVRFGRPIDLEGLITIVTLYVATFAFSVVVVRRARLLVFEGARSVLDAERMTHHLGTYVSAEVAERALSGDELALGGNRQRVVCLFSDLRGFTAYSETLLPEQLVSEVNAYLEAMVAAATSDGGVIDKYIGDAIMVVFGTGTPRPDDTGRAIRTARAMQRAMAKHNLDRLTRGLPSLAQGIGIHGGFAVVGNVGTKSHMQHTVMGSVVNVASRLEAATKDLDVPVLVSADVVEEARKLGLPLPTLVELAPIKIRGVSKPFAVFTFASDGAAPTLPGF